MGMHFDGAYAERIVVPEALLLALPDTLSFEDGALVEPLAVAMHAVNITPFELMDFVVIVGAGPIGLLTLLAARQRGAGSIIVTDRDPHRLGVARLLGADQAIDVGRDRPGRRRRGRDATAAARTPCSRRSASPRRSPSRSRSRGPAAR